MVDDPILRLRSTTSTQDAARRLPIGSVVVADEQTAGRGRLDRTWMAAPGTALLASFVVPPHPLAMLAAAVAAAEACGAPVRIKWPNDLMLPAGKVGGILAEARSGRVILGIGINLTDSPPGAAALGADREAVLGRLRGSLDSWWARSPDAVLARWRELSDTLGRQVRVELPGETFQGIAEDVAEDGSLIVSGRRVSAGDVVHLRPG